MRYGNSAPILLDYLNPLFDYGRFASEANTYAFAASVKTLATCAVRVGDGYSTNAQCQNIGCGGETCSASSQYLIQSSIPHLYCTKDPQATYTIGCDPNSPGYSGCIVKCDPSNEACGHNLYSGLTASGINFTKQLTFKENGVLTTYPMICASDTPQSTDNKTPTCTVVLPTGKTLALQIGEPPTYTYQPLYEPVVQDDKAPTASISGTTATPNITSVNSGTKTLTSSS